MLKPFLRRLKFHRASPRPFTTATYPITGNLHPLARLAFDRGPAADAQGLRRMLLLLQRSPEQESSLLHLLDDQQSKFSPNYQRWLTPADFGKQFGVTDSRPAALPIVFTVGLFISMSAPAQRGRFAGNVGQVPNLFTPRFTSTKLTAKPIWPMLQIRKSQRHWAL